MEEVMSREAHEREVRERQIKIARGMKVNEEILAVLEKVEKWQNREWLYICALDGMSVDQIRELQETNATTGKIRKARMDYLRDKCVRTDLLQKEVESLHKEVREVCNESRKVRRTIEDGLEEALRKQTKAQEETIQAKDQMIGMLQQKIEELNNQLEEKTRLLSGQVSTAQSPYELQNMNRKKETKGISDNRDKKNQQIEKVYADMNFVGNDSAESEAHVQKQDLNRKGFWGLFAEARKESDIKRFIDQYIKNDKMKSEQTEFLLDCLEEGMSVKEIEKFAAPGLPVEVMKRLKNLQKRD